MLAPQAGPQKALIDCPIEEILFGGARGGGKTMGVLIKAAIRQQRLGDAYNGIFFRQELTQADDLIEEARRVLGSIGARFKIAGTEFVFPAGGRLRFRPLRTVDDAAKYQGQNLSDCYVEEAGNYKASEPVDRLWGAMRSAAGFPVQMILTANPGGAGHAWLKQRFITPDRAGYRPLTTTLPNGLTLTRVFIPSLVADNRILMERDKGYIARLHRVGSAQLVKAWVDGDWDAVQGAFFDEWSAGRHIISATDIPADWPRLRALDWGFARPFAVLWAAVAAEPVRARSVTGEPVHVPRGGLIVYREWYGNKRLPMARDDNAAPNVGVRMTAAQVATTMLATETETAFQASVADPSIFATQSGPSVAEQFADAGIAWAPADNTRVAQAGAMSGWQQVRARLRGEGEDGPMLAFAEGCLDVIRTIPALQHDRLRPEDLDTEAEDHAADALRYLCAARPYAPTVHPKPSAPVLAVGKANTLTMNQLLEIAGNGRHERV